MTFTELKLIKPLIMALDKKGYTNPTPIQLNAIPHILERKDVFGCAQTGTGKTAAFALPVLQIIAGQPNRKPGIKALVLAPTRELALQISENFLLYGTNLSISHATIFGGVSQHSQVNALRNGVDVLVATPGRLLDLINQGHVKLNNSEILVLDEADQMLDMGFINDVKKIMRFLPAKRQTLFFSATAAPAIMKLANTFLVNPVHVAVNPVASTAPLVNQSVYYVARENKRLLLNHILKNKTIEHALVFTRTRRGADKVAKDLNKNGITAEAIHGDKSQGARERALKGFKNKNVRILVATDIAARGIDIEKLSHVINFEIPEHAENYVHRIGRTGRAGMEGIALSLCAKDELPYLKQISKLIKKNIDAVNKHPFEMA
jgi:ATP-dependent RNA helicase RhlE